MPKILDEQELMQLLDPLRFLGGSTMQMREFFLRQEVINQDRSIFPSEAQGLEDTVKDINILISEISKIQSQTGNQSLATDANDVFTRMANTLNKTRNAFGVNNEVVSTLTIAAELQILVQALVVAIRAKNTAPLDASINKLNQLTEAILQRRPQPNIVGKDDLPDIQTLTRNLKLEDKGQDVKDVKEFLKAYGCLEGPVNDTFDLHTKNAVVKFQIQVGLDPDGEVGSNTIKAMRDARTEGKQQEPPSTPPVIIPSNIDAKRRLLADIAEREAQKSLTWKSTQSAAEKYLKPLRASGGFSGRYAWCGAFTLWCCREAGIKLPDKPRESRNTYALVAAWHDWATANKFWLPANTRPRRGDIILFDWQDIPGRFNHIGLVIADQLPGDSRIKTAEGNAGNITAIKSRNPATVAGYIRINKA